MEIYFDSILFQFSTLKNKPVSATQLQMDFRGNQFSSSLTVANLDVLNESGRFLNYITAPFCSFSYFIQFLLSYFFSGLVVAHYLRSVSKKVALGAELAYQFGPQVPGYEIALLSLAGRYDGEFCQ